MDKDVLETLTWHCFKCYKSADRRVDIEEWLVYKTQLVGSEWNENLSVD